MFLTFSDELKDEKEIRTCVRRRGGNRKERIWGEMKISQEIFNRKLGIYSQKDANLLTHLCKINNQIANISTLNQLNITQKCSQITFYSEGLP